MADKPMGVMALSIIAIALGAMGFFGSAFGFGALLLNLKTDPPGGQDPKLAEMNAEFHRRIQAVTAETRPVQLVLMPILMVTSDLFAAAGIAGVKLRALGFIRLMFASSLVVDTVGAIYGMIVQSKTMGIMAWYFKEMAAVNKMPPGVEMGMKVGLYAGIFFGVGWLIAKSAVYLWGIIYFSKRSVREAFEAA